MYKKISELVKKNLIATVLKEIEVPLRRDWFAEKEPEIQQKVQEEIQIREGQRQTSLTQLKQKLASDEATLAALKRKHEHLVPPKFKSSVKDPSQIEIAQCESRIRQWKYDIYNYESPIDANRVRTDILYTYSQKFTQTVWLRSQSDFERILNAQLDAFRPEIILEQLCRRHPWLNPGFWMAEQGLLYPFLYKLLADNLCSLRIEPSSTSAGSWLGANARDLREKRFSWSEINFSALEKKIEGYPLSQVEAFYISHHRSEYASMNSAFQSPSLPEGLINLPLRRMDIFRLLHTLKYDYLLSTKVDGIDSTKAAPMHIEELPYLKPHQWAHFQILVINVASEASPIWVLLRKKDDTWRAYGPDDGHEIELGPVDNEFKRIVPGYALWENVPFRTNTALNDITVLNKVAQWHAMLFGKVLPWCLGASRMPLADFRPKHPLSLLYQLVLEQSVFAVTSQKIRAAFVNRQPFTQEPVERLLSEKPAVGSTPTLLADATVLSNKIFTRIMVERLDKEELIIEEDFETLTVKSHNSDPILMLYALTLVYQNKLSRLVYPKMLNESQLTYADHVTIVQQLFEYNTSLMTVRPAPNSVPITPAYALSMHCAARNRFLASHAPALLLAALNNIPKRKALWRTTGQQLLDFFQTQGRAITLDFVNEVTLFNENWKKQFCDHTIRGHLSAPKWSFIQVAQMGVQALDSMFDQLQATYVSQWDPIDKEPSPRLACTLDLAGSLTDNPIDYIRALAERVARFDRVCSPLFSSLGLILPTVMDDVYFNALNELIFVLNQRQQGHPEDVPELILYNLKLDTTIAERLLTKLHDMAASSHSALRVLITVPAWDRDAYETAFLRGQKARYRELQNKILDNKRLVNYQALQDGVKHIYEAALGTLEPQLIIDAKVAQHAQAFTGQDIQYPLTARTPGLQQQLQQQVVEQFQHQQEQEQQQEEEQEQEQEIVQFSGDEGALITRLNIDEKCRRQWEQIPDDVQDFSGWQKENLSQLFSLWVGSDKDAPQVIDRIEPKAIEKLMAHAQQFRLGISRDNLPPGFYLANSRYHQNLILCFSEKRARQAQRDRDSQTLKERNPFTVELHTPKAATLSKGDFRQFSAFSQDLQDQQTLWQHLAIEDDDVLRIQNAKTLLLQNGAPDTIQNQDASVIVQRFDAFKDIKPPRDREDSLRILFDWARQLKAEPALVQALFRDDEQSFALSKSNLRAFGQLFNHYDALATKPGTEHWLYIANELFKAFGLSNIAIWKKRLLDPSQNFAECLDKSEVDAIALSIVTLKGHQDQQKLWWSLVDAHGRSTGHMRYRDLWYAFQKFTSFLQAKNLSLPFDPLARFLEVENFNAKVFLDRLYLVLKKAGNEVNHAEIQQHILNHLDEVDWQHNGLYYASRYERYPFWDRSLHLSRLEETSALEIATYQVAWDSPESILSPVTHALRFASHRIRLSYPDFQTFAQIINDCFSDASLDPVVLRLFIASIAIGVDRLDALNIDEIKQNVQDLTRLDPELLGWLSHHFLLDGELIRGKMQMHWADIIPFVKILSHHRLRFSLMATPDIKQTVTFINASGRALYCYQHQMKSVGEEELFARLLDRVLATRSITPPILTTAPWSVDDKGLFEPNITEYISSKPTAYRALSLLIEQLQSIDFSKSRRLPTQEEMIFAIQQIVSQDPQGEPHDLRRQIVSRWIESGCAIIFQDAQFEPLSEDEMKYAAKYLDTHLKPIFKDQNVELCIRFFTDGLAVRNNDEVRSQVCDLLNLLMRLDNKPYFNELGQVIGVLMTKAQASEPARRFSAPQLKTWLLALLDDAQIEQQHYPLNLLSQLLTQHVQNPRSTLLSADLHQLRVEVLKAGEPQAIQRIVRLILPNQYKPVLVKLLLDGENQFIPRVTDVLLKLHQAPFLSSWLEKMNQLIHKLAAITEPARSNVLHQTAKFYAEYPGVQQIEVLEKLWQQSQTKLIQLLIEDECSVAEFEDFFNTQATAEDAYIKMIVLQAVRSWENDKSQVQALIAVLKRKSCQLLSELAMYYAQEPRPSVEALIGLLANASLNTTEGLIHHFETVLQGLNQDGSSKRHYSITPEDEASLTRVLSGFKRKGKDYIQDDKANKLVSLLYYANNHALLEKLDSLKMPELTRSLHAALASLKQAGTEHERFNASAQLLACMRELLLRKSGKWANHTQMLDLLYAALHNDESLLHQVRTGQGKSIITIMRTTYLALNGYVVDVFSAKESLSERDHEEFAPVMDAMGIAHAYIATSSPVNQYKTESRINGVGAINYATIGNASLFHSTHAWRGNTAIMVDVKRRVAYIDEADHVLTDEKTQFNFSDNNDSDPVYNMDEWVYREAYAFYIARFNTFDLNDYGSPLVSRNTHLKELCERLQKQVIYAPKQSRFFERYIIPALNNDPEAINVRDQQLMQLLSAAHTAHGLKEGVGFCIRPENKTVSGGMVIETQFAKVMIDNQIRHGSTYSDMVQQFLHVRLNMEAAPLGRRPNFFVEPLSQIALSLNAPYLLKARYGKLEGCTGTAGDELDLTLYRERYGIDHVVKLPTHEPVLTNHLPTEFCDTEEAQIAAIVNVIMENNQRPILITCQDDIAVKKLGRKIRIKLTEVGHTELDDKFILDTNDSGKPEHHIVPLAGREGAITISSRLGRGTDIQPKGCPDGLMVLRTYPSIPRIAKQEHGRQGRNGASGTCQDIINYSLVLKSYERYQNSSLAKRLLGIEQSQKDHLAEKVKKHQAKGSLKWSWLDGAIVRDRYIKTRVVEVLKHDEKIRSEQFLRRKEELLATLSGHVQEVFCQQIANSDQRGHTQLTQDWLERIKAIETLWSGRLAGQPQDSEEVFQTFFKQADACWQSLCLRHPALNGLLLLDMVNSVSDLDDGDQATEKFLKKHSEIWNARLQSGRVDSTNDTELRELKSQVKRLYKKYHTDKVAISQARSTEKIEEIKKLQDLLDKCLKVIKPVEEPTTVAEGDDAEDNVAPDGNADDTSGWAMVLATPTQRSRLEDMPTVVKLYQHYLKGALKYYFSKTSTKASNELLCAIYGDDRCYLDELYLQVFIQSTNAQEHVLPFKEQTIRRDSVFKALIELMKAPGIYCISSQALSKMIESLMNEPDKRLFERNLQVLQRFVDQSLPDIQSPADLAPNDIKKIDTLLLLTFEIVGTNSLERNDTAFNFVANFSKAIHRHFWTNFDEILIQEIKRVFLANPEISALLMRHTNAADLAYLFDLLLANKDTRHGLQRCEKLIGYLQKHATELGAMPQILRPLFNVILAGSPYGINESYLPIPHMLPNLPREIQGRFWHFLSQRQPYEERDVMALIGLLSDCSANAYCTKNLIEPLLKLPQLPLKYIKEHLIFSPGAHLLEDAHTQLSQMALAGDAFNRFLLERGLLEANHLFMHPVREREAAVGEWQSWFNRMSPTRNQQFFTTAQHYSGVSLELMSFIVAAFADGRLSNNEQLENVLKLAQDVQQIDPESTALLTITLHRHLTEAAQRMKTKLLQLGSFVTMVKQQGMGISSDEVSWLLARSTDLTLIELVSLIGLMKKIMEVSGGKSWWLRRELGSLLQTRSDDLKLCLERFTSFVRLVSDETCNHLLGGVALKKLREVWQSLSEQEYQQMLRQLDILSQLSGEKRLFMREKLYQVLQSSDRLLKPGLINFKTFLSIIAENNDPQDAPSLQLLYNRLTEGSLDPLGMAVKEGLILLQEIRQFERLRPGFNLFTQYQRHSGEANAHKHYLDFVRVMNQPENQDLHEEIRKLYIAYFDTKTISKGVHLKRAIDALRAAQELLTKQNYREIFSPQASPEHRHIRRGIMQYLEHDLLNLGQAFKDNCYRHYKILAEKLAIFPNDLNDAKPSERAKLFRNHYQKIQLFADEIAVIGTHPGQKLPRPAVESGIAIRKSIQVRHAEYFAIQQKRYASFWFTNSERKDQAKTLFCRTLALTSNEIDRAVYYQKTLTAIWEAEKAILNSDRNTTRNTKGFSRLYDISMQMYIAVARDYLADDELSFEQKVPLKMMLNEQVIFHLQLLIERLPDAHVTRDIIALLDREQRNIIDQAPSTLLSELGEILPRMTRESVPRQLHYILDNLACFAELSPDEEPTIEAKTGVC
jgi:hypothetical protein